jgi:hypothetical protein
MVHEDSEPCPFLIPTAAAALGRVCTTPEHRECPGYRASAPVTRPLAAGARGRRTP